MQLNNPGNAQNARASIGSFADRSNRRFPAQVHKRMAGQIGCEVRLDPDWAYSRTSTAMRDAKSLCKFRWHTRFC